jgi:DNA-binding CsgD family transcriptional regulator/PAS domain-containing protein
MGLHLSSRDVQRYREATEALLSPLDYDGATEWCAAVLQRVEALFRADRAMLVLPADGEVRAHSQSIPPEGLTQLQSAVSAMVPGGFRSASPQVDTVMRGRRAVGLDVWHNEALALAAGVSLDSIPFYHEVMVPNGVAYGSGMVTALPLGEAWLSVAHSRPADDPFGVEGGLELLRMLHPAFRAGAISLVEAVRRREAFAHTFEALGQAVMACDLDGRERYRSAHLCRILNEEPETDRIESEMHALASTVAMLRRAPSKSAPSSVGRVGQRDVTTARTRYALSAVLVAADAFGAGGGVLVRLEEEGLTLPSRDDLMDRYGLTPREAEVALLLARGASNREAARRLYISPYTVRTHVEHIFRKLGIHSRKALALELLSDRPHGA